MCAGTANTYFILRHTTAPPIPSTLRRNLLAVIRGLLFFDTNVQYALRYPYGQAITSQRNGEFPITKRRSIDTYLCQYNNGKRSLYSLWDQVYWLLSTSVRSNFCNRALKLP